MVDDDGDDTRSLFEEAMRDVEPVAGPRPVRQRRRPERTVAAPAGPRPPRFTVERDGPRVSGLAEGRRPRLLARLRGGGFPLARRVDLHGFTAAEARAEVEAELAAAGERGERCVLVIHGRGRGSAGGPVLKEALPDWLVAPPLAHRVVAFVTAPEPLGGSGATLVLLRERKPSRG
jgi:DNA-nicking Smr family endonuclease